MHERSGLSSGRAAIRYVHGAHDEPDRKTRLGAHMFMHVLIARVTRAWMQG